MSGVIEDAVTTGTIQTTGTVKKSRIRIAVVRENH